jgi:hypothetical protein
VNIIFKFCACNVGNAMLLSIAHVTESSSDLISCLVEACVVSNNVSDISSGTATKVLFQVLIGMFVRACVDTAATSQALNICLPCNQKAKWWFSFMVIAV